MKVNNRVKAHKDVIELVMRETVGPFTVIESYLHTRIKNGYGSTFHCTCERCCRQMRLPVLTPEESRELSVWLQKSHKDVYR
jgi:hypothetical protein